MLLRRTILQSVFLVGMLLSCDDDVKPKVFDTTVVSGKNSKTWKLTGFVARKAGREDVSFFAGFDPCERDDRYTFYADADKLFEVSNGLFECSDEEEDVLLVSYTWSFNSANATLSMVFPHVFGYYFIPFTIKEIDDEEMELEIFINEEGTDSYALFLEKVSEE